MGIITINICLPTLHLPLPYLRNYNWETKKNIVEITQRTGSLNSQEMFKHQGNELRKLTMVYTSPNKPRQNIQYTMQCNANTCLFCGKLQITLAWNLLLTWERNESTKH